MTSLSSIRRLIAASGVAVFASPAFSDYVVNQIDYVDPDTGAVANFTELWSSNKHAAVLGHASFDGGTTAFAFVYDSASGNYARVPLPPGFDNITKFASHTGINDAGVIVGSASELVDPPGCEPGQCEPIFGLFRGFTLKDGVYSFFQHPDWANTSARTIGNPTPAHPAGLVAGHVDDGTLATPRSWRGIVYDPAKSEFMTIDMVDGFIVLPHGQNASGRIVGSIFGFGGQFVCDETGEPCDDGALPLGQSGFVFTPALAGDPMQGGSVSYYRINGLRTFFRGFNDQGVIAAGVRSASFPNSNATYVGTVNDGTVNDFQPLNSPSAVTGGLCPNFQLRGLFPEHLNNAGQIFGQYVDSDCNMHGFVATPASLPTGTTITGAHRFSVDVSANSPAFISAPTAHGYFYAAGWRDPAIATVRLPLGFGDNKFVVIAGLRVFAVNAGQLFDFRAHGFANGVRAFSVACIDPAARLHPVNSLAFPTELTFVGTGKFTGVQQPFPDLTERGFPPPGSAECRQALLSLRQ